METNNFETVFRPAIEKSIEIYEASCKKFNKNPGKPLYSWEMKLIFEDYIQNNGFIQSWGLNTSSKIHAYSRDCYGKSFTERLLNYDIYVFFERLPIKFPYYLFCFVRKIFALTRSKIWSLIWYTTVLKKELKIWKSMKRNGCYAGPDPRKKYKGRLNFIPVKNKINQFLFISDFKHHP